MPGNYTSGTIIKVDKAFQPPETMRLILNFIVPIASLLSTIPAALAWRHGGVERGTTMNSDFYQAIADMMRQFLSLITLWPSLSDPQLSIKSRFLIWTLAVFSGLSSLLSVPLYLMLSTTWSFIVAFIGGVAQAILQLQVINLIMWPSNYKKLGTTG
jgi:hypothetical protein